MKGNKERITEVAADQHEVALGDVEGVRAFEDYDKTDGDEGINHAHGKTGYH